jgi:copper chaperone NosL
MRNTVVKSMPGLCLTLLALSLLACEKNQLAEMPPAQTLTRDANGYYCLMTVVNHSGPKGQIILDDRVHALWFTSVRDTIAFTLSPEEPKNIAAIYVNDMANADWDDPGADNWIDARKAWYVIGSGHAGGMGAPEAVPFSTKQQADQFARKHGGNTYTFKSIPPDYITGTNSGS